MRRAATGWFFAVTSVLTCPCLLVFTLPLAAALLGGTALGGWIAAHQGVIVAGAGLYFVAALAAAYALLAGRRALARRFPKGVKG